MRKVFGLVIVLVWLTGSAMGQTENECRVTSIAKGKIVVKCPQRSPVPACADSNKDPACVDTIYDIPKAEWAGIPGWGKMRPRVGLKLSVTGDCIPDNEQGVYTRSGLRANDPRIPRCSEVGKKVEHAHAQQKAVVSPAVTPKDSPKPSAAIPIAEPEASALKALQVEANKAHADYQKQIQLISAKWELLIVQAAAKSSLTYTQLTNLIPSADESGKWVWKPKPEFAKTETPKEKQ